ncbi:hypothetical protein [Pontibacter kalidii]|uniref:hypothetical protein n=1 Tax=Pontibacter kalidii TaxID=2592049 RepID=UPI002251D071|nr:hypothetical protein [Pontibacter kalidii]
MKKILFIALGAFTFACSDASDNTTADEATMEENNMEESVEIGAGEEISPQLDLDSGENARLDVDTLSRKTVEEQQQ